MSYASIESHVPRGVTVRWGDAYATEVYRAPASRRPSVITVMPSRKGLGAAGGASVGGATGAALLVEYGLTHARGLATLAGVSLAVIAGVLADRIAPRLLTRTEVRFTHDALEIRHRPFGDARPTRIPYSELASFEVEVVVDPVATPPVLVHHVNARLTNGTVEPVIASVVDAETAAWLRRALTTHALPG